MDEFKFHHALKINRDLCIGCSHCMKTCSTEAIRIHEGKAVLYDNRCMDCGQCYLVCPVSAIYVAQDDFSKIYDYKHRVVILPGLLLAQFNDHLSFPVTFSLLEKLLLDMGFTDVFEIENIVDFLIHEQDEYAQRHSDVKPLISTYCPAVVRLIQVKFPSLTENLLLMKQPLDVAAMYCKQKLIKEGVKGDDIGVFYITPCAAKIAAVKNPVGEDKSAIDGVINMDFIFNKILRKIKEEKWTEDLSEDSTSITPNGVLWSLNEGESHISNRGRTLAIDGIEYVNAYLEKLEDIEESDVDFLELRACDHGCAGGILMSGLRFLIAEQMKKRARIVEKSKKINPLSIDDEILAFLKENLSVQKVHPRSMMTLDKDISVAMRKMNQIRDMMKLLPKKDCGVCGAPSCQAFAEDIANEKAEMKNCVFIQTHLEERGCLISGERVEIFKKIWGDDIFNNYSN